VTEIWKYPIDISQAPLAISMPFGARILTLQVQHGVPCLWALVNPTATKVARPFVVVGTGHKTPRHAGEYVGTWQDGPYVWHLFEEASRG
jgi:hypothetical protein